MPLINRILLVEDDLAAQAVLKRMIQKIQPDAFVKVVGSAEEAYRTLNEDQLDHLIKGASHHPYDLVVSDLGLPGSDGLVLLDVATKKFPALDFLFVSGITFEEWSKRLPNNPHWPAFLRKPVSEEQLRHFWSDRFSLAGQFGG